MEKKVKEAISRFNIFFKVIGIIFATCIIISIIVLVSIKASGIYMLIWVLCAIASSVLLIGFFSVTTGVFYALADTSNVDEKCCKNKSINLKNNQEDSHMDEDANWVNDEEDSSIGIELDDVVPDDATVDPSISGRRDDLFSVNVIDKKDKHK